MRTDLSQLELPAEPKPSRIQACRSRRTPSFRTCLLLLATAALFGCGFQVLRAQTPAAPAQTAPTPAPPAPKPGQRAAHPHRRAGAHADAAPVAPAPVTPPAPEIPKWPANEKPNDATVTWDSQGLRITASNSSLQQILSEIATATGAKIEGMDKDVRIFGAYGPGQPRDVLSQLLDGSGYNVLMIGDQGQGAPRQIVLTARQAGSAQAAKSAPTPTADDDVEVEDQTQQQEQQRLAQPPFRPAFQPGAQPRAPQTNPGQPQPGTPPNE